MTGRTLLAHAFGKRYDLPIPLYIFVLGGALVVFVSFLVVLPRAVGAGAPGGSGPDRLVLPRGRRVPMIAATAVLVLLVAAGLFGSDKVAGNILPTAVWLLAWIAVPISCGIVGDWTKRINPFAALARLADGPRLRRVLVGRDQTLAWPRRWSWWPVVLFFFLAASGELIYNQTATLPRFTAIALIVYGVMDVAAAAVFGAGTWLRRGELFTILFDTWGRLGWWRFGAPGRRGFGGGLEVPFEASVSRITFVLLLLVSVSFDGLLATPTWKAWRLRLPSSIGPGSTAYLLLTTAAFIALILVSWGLFLLFAAAVRKAGRLSIGAVETVAGLLPSLLPIAFGYLVAHNFEYLLINGQLLIPLADDPAGLGWHLLPTANFTVNSNILPSGPVWYIQLALIVAVHVAAVVVAHRFLARAAPDAGRARSAEWPWILAMLAYTMTSLWLLAQPLVQQVSG